MDKITEALKAEERRIEDILKSFAVKPDADLVTAIMGEIASARIQMAMQATA